MMHDGTFSVPVELTTSRIHRRDLSAAGATHRAQVAPQKPAGLWIRQLIEKRPEYLAQIIRQQSDYAGEQAKCFMILCGAGHDILVLVNDTPWPANVNVVPKLSVSLFLTTRTLDNPDDDILHQYGSIDPLDELWIHMMLAVRAGVFPGRFRIYLASRSNGPAYLDSSAVAKVTLRVRMDKNGCITRSSQLSPKDAPAALFPFSNQENDTRMNRPDRKRAAIPSTTLTQKKKPKISTKSDNVQRNLLHNTKGATTVPPKQGPTKDMPGQKAVGKTVLKKTTKRPNLYGFSLEEFQTLQNAYEQSLHNPNHGDTAEVPARYLYGFSLLECKVLEHAYEAAMTQPDPPKAKVIVPLPEMDSIAAVTPPTKATKGSTVGRKSRLPSNLVVPITKVNGDFESPGQNLYGFSAKELKMLENAYETLMSTSANLDGGVPPPILQAFAKPQSKKPIQVVKPSTPSALAVTAEAMENQKRCFYFPYCTKLSSECGGRQRGRCHEVKAGNVKLPKDDQEFRKVKKKALRSLNQQKKKPFIRAV
jgi:hypothetical protein